MAAYLYIVRHGECQNNVTKIILPPDEDVLTDRGKLQAELLGTHLKDVKFTKVFSSDYARCVQTTTHILSKSKYPEVVQLKIRPDERIRERNVGSFEGGPYPEVVAYLAENIFVQGIPPMQVEFPGGGDTSAEMLAKAESFFKDILNIVDNSETSESILVTSHGFAMLYMATHLKQSTDQYKLNNATEILSKVAPNTGFFKLRIPKKPEGKNGSSTSIPRQIDVLAEHDTSHLNSLKKDDPVAVFAKGTKFDGCIHQ